MSRGLNLKLLPFGRGSETTPHTSDLRHAYRHSWNEGRLLRVWTSFWLTDSWLLLGYRIPRFSRVYMASCKQGPEEMETSKLMLPPRTFPSATDTKSPVLKCPIHSLSRGCLEYDKHFFKKINDLLCVEVLCISVNMP